MAFPKDLRQKMINLMYLVLMAMLAINIDPAALQGYKTINDGMEYSYNAFKSGNEAVASTISSITEEEKKPYQIELDSLAQELVGTSSELDSFIDGVIAEVRSSASGSGEYSADSKDPADEVMISNDLESGKAMQLQKRLNDLLVKYNSIVDAAPEEISDSLKTVIKSSFALKNPTDEDARADDDNEEGKGWALWTFAGKPAIAIEAILNQIKNDAKATEGQILQAFADKMDATKIDWNLDQYYLALIPESTYLPSGERFKARLTVGQSSSQAQSQVQIFVNGSAVPVNSKGIAEYTAPPRGVGEHTVTARAVVTNPQTGERTEVPLESPVKYKVAQPSATVSADKMNVFYVGLDNPVSVSATGASNLKASCSGCTSFSPNGSGGYNAKVPASLAGKEVTVNVSSSVGNDSKVFRVMKVPNPEVRLGNFKPSTAQSTNSIAAQSLLRATLPNFPYNTKFTVVGFRMSLFKSGAGSFTRTSSNNRLTSEMTGAIRQVGANWFVIFSDIKVQGPGGEIRDVGSVTYVTR